jgi:circadian clock protein KaiC
MEKINSGIEGFDQLLYGGYPSGRAYLIAGEPGTGKTIFSLQFLLEGLRSGEKAIYISIDEKPEGVIRNSESLGWDLKPYLESGQLQILDVTSYFGTSNIGKATGINIDRIIEDILGYVKKNNVKRLAIDPIAPLIFTKDESPDIVDYIRRLIFALEDNTGCTTLLTSYVPVGSDKVSHHGIEEFAASGIILLKLKKSKNKYIRTVWVRKMRGTRIDLTEYSFEILPTRGVVLRHPVS